MGAAKKFKFTNIETGDEYEVSDGDTLGRKDADINIDGDRYISKKHLKVKIIRDNLFIVDFGASNPTRIDGVPVEQNKNVKLAPGKFIEVGTQTLRLDEKSVNEELEINPSNKNNADVIPIGNKFKKPGSKIANLEKTDSKIKKFHDTDSINIDYPLAGIFQRWLAAFLDGIFFGAISQIGAALITFVIGMIKSEMGPLLILPLVLLMQFAVIWFYFYRPLKNNGQTLGKKLLKVKVIMVDRDREISFGTVIIRELIGKILSSIFMFGYLMACWDKENRALHDKMAGTKVVSLKYDGKED